MVRHIKLLVMRLKQTLKDLMPSDLTELRRSGGAKLSAHVFPYCIAKYVILAFLCHSFILSSFLSSVFFVAEHSAHNDARGGNYLNLVCLEIDNLNFKHFYFSFLFMGLTFAECVL